MNVFGVDCGRETLAPSQFCEATRRQDTIVDFQHRWQCLETEGEIGLVSAISETLIGDGTPATAAGCRQKGRGFVHWLLEADESAPG